MKCLSSLRHCTDILVVKASYCRSLPTSSFHVKALGDRCASIARIFFVRTTRMSPAASSTLRWCPIVPLGRPSDCAAWFGVLTLAEVVLAAVGAVVLWRRGKSRWTAWWIAFVVALHFMPLAFLLRDWSRFRGCLATRTSPAVWSVPSWASHCCCSPRRRSSSSTAVSVFPGDIRPW